MGQPVVGPLFLGYLTVYATYLGHAHEHSFDPVAVVGIASCFQKVRLPLMQALGMAPL